MTDLFFRSRIVLTLVSLLFLAFGLTSAPAGPSRFAIVGVSVVDVSAGTTLPDRTVVVAGDRIETVGPASGVAVPSGTVRIDGRGRFLMPGLIDAHVHFTIVPQVFGRLLVANGVVAARDMGQPNESALALRRQVADGSLLGPELIVTGWLLDGDPPIIPAAALAVKTPEEGRAAVARQAEAGVDQIKVYSKLEKDVFLAIVEEAKRRNLAAVGHVPESVWIEDAVSAGLRSLEHLSGFQWLIARLLGVPVTLKSGGQFNGIEHFLRLGEIDRQRLQEALRPYRESGIAICPTIVTMKVRADDVLAAGFPGGEYVPSELRSMWRTWWTPSQRELFRALWPNLAKLVRELHEAGAMLIVGTDLLMPGVVPGFSVHEEMAIWQDAGIPAADVLRSATLVPARFLGQQDRLGTVEAGKAASFLLLDADPLADVRNAGRIEGVCLRGRWFDRAALDALKREARALAARPEPARSPRPGGATNRVESTKGS